MTYVEKHKALARVKKQFDDVKGLTGTDFVLVSVKPETEIDICFLRMACNNYNHSGADCHVDVAVPVSATKALFDFAQCLYKAVQHEYESFDVDEEVYGWLEAKVRGLYGVPYVGDLVQSAEFKREQLQKFQADLNAMLNIAF